MMMKNSRLLMLALAAVCGAPQAALAGEPPAGAIEVHFAAGMSAPESAAARKARLAEAQRKAKEVEQRLKAQYGKDESEWPPEKAMELLQAQAATLDTLSAHDQASGRDVSDSIQDMTAAATGTPGDGLLHPVSSPEAAHLVVEVMGRRSEKADAFTGLVARYGLLLRIAPGGRLDPARLARTKVFWMGANVTEVHRYSAEEPYWTLEVLGVRRWTDAATRAVSLLAGLVRQSPQLFAPKED
jgi:hypothetical protein